ncbi:energy transducer TonB [Flavobacterium sp.]|uniref:energy transducer TonB n=1 Tax=Flavobacterium sp. TaxID=239 RepID=UPI00286CC92A|nr:energy transducer TonB [Flavobacterium sp.]
MHKHLLIYFVLFAGFAFSQGKVRIPPTYCPSKPFNPITVKHNDTIVSLAAVGIIKPEFPGGINAFYKSFGAAFKMPTEKPDLTGRIFVSFVVRKDGSMSDIRILRDLGYGTGAEAIRVIKKMTKWKPAQYQGKAVHCDYSLPIKIPYEPFKPSISKLKVVEIPDKH